MKTSLKGVWIKLINPTPEEILQLATIVQIPEYFFRFAYFTAALRGNVIVAETILRMRSDPQMREFGDGSLTHSLGSRLYIVSNYVIIKIKRMR